jgi:hypothetical protein
MNLILAIIWLLLTLGVFGWRFFTGQEAWMIKFPGSETSLSVGWLTLALCLYNLARWYSTRAYRKELREQQLAQARRHYHSRQPVGEPDPTFDFTSAPKPPPSRNITDQPPSNN